MPFPKLTELPDITDWDSTSLQAIIRTKNIADWQELYRSAALDLINSIHLLPETDTTLRTIQKGIREKHPWYDKDWVEQKLGIKLLVCEVALEVKETVTWALRANRALIREERAQSVSPVQNNTHRVIQASTVPQGEDDEDIAYEAPKPKIIQGSWDKHTQSVENDMKNHAGTPEWDIYIRLLAYLKQGMALTIWEIPLYDEVVINKKGMAHLSLSYWERVKQSKQWKREALVEACIDFPG